MYAISDGITIIWQHKHKSSGGDLIAAVAEERPQLEEEDIE
jgi:hypothetical protein